MLGLGVFLTVIGPILIWFGFSRGLRIKPWEEKEENRRKVLNAEELKMQVVMFSGVFLFGVGVLLSIYTVTI